MSEYQYYEFQAVDRPLTKAEQKELRALSSRARITAASFANHYDWGDLKGDPRTLVERYFDLHLYLANWASRRLMIRLPKRLVDVAHLRSVLRDVEWVAVSEKGDNLIVDFLVEEIEQDADDFDDGSGWLAAMAPLRADVLAGDFRLFYLAWLEAVGYGGIGDDAVEPLPGIGPLSGPLEAFAEFFALDADLVAAASERTGVVGDDAGRFRDAARAALAAMPDHEKTKLLLRVADGDPHAVPELRKRLRASVPQPAAGRRRAGDLRSRATAIREDRERLLAEKREAERRRKAKQEARARRARLDTLRQRGTAAWKTVETEIERRHPAGYDAAFGLLADLQAIASEDGTLADFASRLAAIRERHARKGKFIERLQGLAAP
jgi:hypothetical protein